MTDLQEIQSIDDSISVNEGRVAELNVAIGKLKRKRELLVNALSAEDRAKLAPVSKTEPLSPSESSG